ncbi:MAG: hypothetical protein KY459_05495 [Acidobacteria bacterium]|nr:hypothetical protein [Acidobacteriota bacterium]
MVTEPQPQKKKAQPGQAVAAGIAIGLSIGLLFGVALDNLALGLALGMGLGLVFGGAQEKKRAKEPLSGDPATDLPESPAE